MPTFDIVNKLDRNEVTNALNQAVREIGTRFDFRGTETSVEETDEGIVIRANSEGRVAGALAVLEEKMIKRKVSLLALDRKPAAPVGGQMWKQLIALKEGVAQDKAKEIIKAIKDSKIKVQASIQGDLVRVSGKKRDELQETIAYLRAQNFELPLQFINFRD